MLTPCPSAHLAIHLPCASDCSYRTLHNCHVPCRSCPQRRDGATIPALAEFQQILGAPTTKFGWGLGERIHAPNERLKVSALVTVSSLFHEPLLTEGSCLTGTGSGLSSLAMTTDRELL